MEKLNLEGLVLDEKGVPIEGGKLTFGRALGKAMLTSNSTAEVDILKLFKWAGELSRTDEIEVDEIDAKIIKDFIINDENLFILVKAPIIKVIDALKF